MITLFRNRKSSTVAALVNDEIGTAIVSVQNIGKPNVSLQKCEFIPSKSGKNDVEKSNFKTLGLDKYECSTLLNIGEYQLLVVDAPEVPPQELKAAVRWIIQDLIDFHVDDAVIDVFSAPPGGPAGTREQMYVVVARDSTIRDKIYDLENSGANLKVIDIPELAMRNLAARLPEDESGLVTLYFTEQQCLITLTHKATLFLTRTVDFNYNFLSDKHEKSDESKNRLALEIQRSLDYYEQHFHQAAITNVAVIPPPIKIDRYVSSLQETLGLTIRIIALNDVISGEQELELPYISTFMLAIGCALRTEIKSL